MTAFLPLIVVALVPVLTASSRAWLFNGPRSVPVWAAVLGATLVAVGVKVQVVPGNLGGAALAATPLMQALVFVLADRVFFLLTGRVPVSYDDAKWNRRPDSRRWWPDKLFWILTFFGLIGLGVVICAQFGVEFPART